MRLITSLGKRKQSKEEFNLRKSHPSITRQMRFSMK